MSSISNQFLLSSISEGFFRVALTNYTSQTGVDLMNDPLTVRVKDCSTPNATLDVLQEQALAFDEVKNGDAGLMNHLRVIIDDLHVLPSHCACISNANLVSLEVSMLSITIH